MEIYSNAKARAREETKKVRNFLKVVMKTIIYYYTMRAKI